MLVQEEHQRRFSAFHKIALGAWSCDRLCSTSVLVPRSSPQWLADDGMDASPACFKRVRRRFLAICESAGRVRSLCLLFGSMKKARAPVA